MGFLVQTGRIEWFEAEIAKKTSLKMHRPMSMKTEFLLKMAVPGQITDAQRKIACSSDSFMQ